MSNVRFPLSVIIILTGTFFMIIHPQATVQAASQGLLLWYSIVLPALLPFFIVAELLVKIRFVNFMGVLMEPVMHPLFRLPGCSALVVVLGFTSGFPVGAVLTRKLYDQQQLSTEEAERLLVFTNNASPLFILGAVGIGLLSNPAAGYLLAFSQYLSNLLLGILLRFKAPRSAPPIPPGGSGWKAACQASLFDNGERSGFAGMLGDAIRDSLGNVMAVGGFIVVFSVLTHMLSQWGLLEVMAGLLFSLLNIFPLDYAQVYGLCMGIFEMTLGAKTAAIIVPGNMLAVLLVLSAILAFSGISVIAQVMSIMAGTSIRLSFYLLSRLLQMAMACSITFLAYRLALLTGMAGIQVQAIPYHKVLYAFDAWTWSLYSLLAAFIIIAVLLCMATGRQHQ
ncbi:MAG TPA: sporulation integral membrane protein YlbJ [Syntrophomonas sp.]|nr:sporulation integral membrane protein YlbJ [Syntrophomonas sp.]